MPRKPTCCQTLLALLNSLQGLLSSLQPPPPVPTRYQPKAAHDPFVQYTSPQTNSPQYCSFHSLAVQQQTTIPVPAQRRPLKSAPPPLPVQSPHYSNPGKSLQSQDIKKPHKKSRSGKAGLEFPVGRIDRLMKKRICMERIGADAPVYVAAVLEYLAAEILELAGNAVVKEKLKRITPKHICLAITRDGELNGLLRNAVIACGGARLTELAPERSELG